MCSLCAGQSGGTSRGATQKRRGHTQCRACEGSVRVEILACGDCDWTVQSLLDPSPESPPHAGETGTARPPRRAQHAIGHAVFTHRDFFVQIPSRGRGGDEN